MKRFNSNYIKNSKNTKRIKRVVQEYVDEDINKQPYDFLFRNLGEDFPQTNHEFLNLPGVFNKIETMNGFLRNGKNIQMDLVESILPDGKIVKYPAITNMEHQARELSPSKIEDMFFYTIFIIGKFKQPCFSYVVTNIDHGVSEKIYEVDGHPLKIHFILFDKKKIYKILSNLNKKDFTISEMSEMDFLKFNYSLIFAKDDYAKDVVEKCVELFTSMEKIRHEHQLFLLLSLKIMIKYHFKDDMVKTRELLTMVVKAVSDNMIDELPLYQRNRKRLSDAQDTIAVRDNTITEQKQTIAKQKQTIAEQEDTIAEQEDAIAKRDEEIELLKAEIKSLKG